MSIKKKKSQNTDVVLTGRSADSYFHSCLETSAAETFSWCYILLYDAVWAAGKTVHLAFYPLIINIWRIFICILMDGGVWSHGEKKKQQTNLCSEFICLVSFFLSKGIKHIQSAGRLKKTFPLLHQLLIQTGSAPQWLYEENIIHYIEDTVYTQYEAEFLRVWQVNKVSYFSPKSKWNLLESKLSVVRMSDGREQSSFC